ncbi:MAG: sialate O-acetylesterase [Opitutaceae bacterium]
MRPNPVSLILTVSTVLLANVAALRADVRLPAIFSDHLVLQRDVAVPVWGWADPGEKVSVAFGGRTVESVAGADGSWMAKIGPLTATATPGTLAVKGRNEIVIHDVLVGEVWLGSGQSNMAMTVSRSADFPAEQPAAKFATIRMFKEESARAASPQREGKGKWVICTPETVGNFSAALYFFGREIHRSIGTPVGLINSSVGGTPIESWIAEAAQRAAPELKGFFAGADKPREVSAEERRAYEASLAKWEEAVKAGKKTKGKAPRRPQDPAEVANRKSDIGGLFNGKIAPLIPYALRGLLWYQGEANTFPGKADFYEAQLRLLVNDWRARWGGEIPFAWAQLPNFTGTGRDWPAVREAMRNTLALPRTGMAITIDVGEANDIHPTNKQEVGRRLALWALGAVYRREVPAVSGPLPNGHEARDGAITVRFQHANGGLVAKDGALRGFEIAGADGKWVPAESRIAGDNVTVSSSAVPKPAAVRYAWANLPEVSLYNGAGLPASPFALGGGARAGSR